MNEGYHPESPVGNGASPIPALIAGIVHDAQKLISQQIELLKREIKEDIRNLALALAFVAVGASLCFLSIIMLCFAGVYGLNALTGQPMWACFLIATAVFLSIGGLLMYLAVRRLLNNNPLPDQTLEGLKENLTWKTNPK